MDVGTDNNAVDLTSLAHFRSTPFGRYTSPRQRCPRFARRKSP